VDVDIIKGDSCLVNPIAFWDVFDGLVYVSSLLNEYLKPYLYSPRKNILADRYFRECFLGPLEIIDRVGNENNIHSRSLISR
jgi:hypothetical protein